MNRNQRFVALMGLIIFIGMGLIPPWIYEMPTLHGRVERPACYGSIFSPPTPLIEGYTVGGVRLDVQRLLIGWFVVSLCTGILVFSLKGADKILPVKESVVSRFTTIKTDSPAFDDASAPPTFETPPVSPPVITLDDAPKDEKLPVGWLMFWSHIRLPLGAFVNMAIFARMGLVGLLIGIAVAAWMICLAVGLHRYRLWAWKQNWFIIFGEAVSWGLKAVEQEQQSDVGSKIGAFIGGSLIVLLVWSWPNYIYFKKRKELFH